MTFFMYDCISSCDYSAQVVTVYKEECWTFMPSTLKVLQICVVCACVTLISRSNQGHSIMRFSEGNFSLWFLIWSVKLDRFWCNLKLGIIREISFSTSKPLHLNLWCCFVYEKIILIIGLHLHTLSQPFFPTWPLL